MKKLFVFFIVFLLVIASFLSVAQAGSTYSTGGTTCVFMASTGEGLVLRTKYLNNNIFMDFSSDRSSLTVTRVKCFGYAEQTPYLEFYSVTSVLAPYVSINGTDYSTTNKETNVIVGPDWIWDSRYRDFNYTTSSAVNYGGTVNLYLSNECVPQAHTYSREARYVW